MKLLSIVENVSLLLKLVKFYNRKFKTVNCSYLFLLVIFFYLDPHSIIERETLSRSPDLLVNAEAKTLNSLLLICPRGERVLTYSATRPNEQLVSQDPFKSDGSQGRTSLE